MREFSIEYGKLIPQGLRKDFRMGRDIGALVSLFNAKPTEFGLRQFEFHTIPTALQTQMTAKSIVVAHPFPQFFKGRTQDFLLTATKLYSVASDYTLTQINTFDPLTDVAANITGSSSWQFADNKDSYVFFNGTCVIFKWKVDSLVGGVDLAYVFTSPFINTGNAIDGRMVFGGFSNGLWSDAWNAFWAGFDGSQGLNTSFNIDDDTVMWSSVGGSEFFWLVRPDLVLTEDNSKLIQTLKSNQWGWHRLDHNIVKILPIGQGGFVVYGDSGITLFFPTSVQGAPTFGTKKLAWFGIPSRNAVGMVDGTHVFIDQVGTMWSLHGESGLKELGFKEFFSSMVTNDITIVTDPGYEKDVIISDNLTSFVLTKGGTLGEISRLYTSLFYTDDTYGIFEDTLDDSFELIIDSVAFGSSAMKTIKSVEVIGTDTNVSGVTVALDYSFSKGQVYKRTAFKPTNKQGIAYVIAHGHDFRIILRATDHTAVELDNITVKVQYDDKRNTRGLVGNQVGATNVS